MTQPSESATPDFDALRDTRPNAASRPDEELATEEGPATASENAVDEDMGRGEA